LNFSIATRKSKDAKSLVAPDYYALNSKENIVDPFANDGMGKTIMLKNIISFEPVELPSGETTLKPILEKPAFKKGVIELTHEQNNTYIFLMRSKKNKDNPFHKKGRKIFRKVNTKKEQYDALQDEDLEYQAQKLVREANWTDKRAIINKLNTSPDPRFHVKASTEDMQGMNLELIRLAKKFPKRVIMSSGDIVAKTKVYIADAMVYGLLLWNNEHSSWSIYQPDSKKDRMIEMLTVGPDEEKIDALITHFKTDEGRKHYTVIVTALQKILKATA
jgi:hypothetical protein